jgi:mono/diheme cytochrome c family protein
MSTQAVLPFTHSGKDKMSDEKKEAGRGKGLPPRKVALLAVGLGISVATGFVLNAYLQRQAASPVGVDDPLRIDWMFIDAGDADLVIEGRKVYEANCANCHGFGLEGQPDWDRRGPDGVLPAPPHNETGHTWHHPDAVLFATVKLGGQAFMPQGVLSGMPAYKDILDDREIEASLAYIKSRWPSKIRRKQEMRTNQSR